MSDESQELTEQTTEIEEAHDAPAEEASPASPESVAQLPDWAQRIVKDLRQENAKHRKAKQAAEKEAEKLAQQQAEEQGEYRRLYEEEKAKREHAEVAKQAAELAILKEKIGRELNVPGALIGRLQGETEDELRQDAELIVASLPKAQATTATDAAAGQNQAESTPGLTEEDVKEFAARYGLSFNIAKQQLLNNQ